MGKVTAESIVKRGVYGCFDGDELVYVGSTALGIWKLEYNHRNWFRLGYSKSKFRQALVTEGKNWQFKWLLEPYKCNQRDIETEEGCLIKQHRPRCNKDLDPVRSSIRYGRYEPECFM